jgi:NitT/TauT family transport system ATP-binding protein
MITVNQLTKRFDPESGEVLDRITFTLSAGATLSIIGPSGCGKTTLLYLLAGLQAPTGGSVSVGSGGDEPAGKTAIILQSFGLFPWKSVRDNVALGLKIHRVSENLSRRKVQELLEELGLAELANRFPVQLSGGQQQRVAIARALATDPDILLMDEPFSALDALTREHLQTTLLELWRRRRLTYIIVTHSVEEAVFLGSRIMVLSDRPTRVKAIVDNRGFGIPDHRLQSAFFDRVREIRRMMEH